jgi:hypothetical protein
MEYCVQANSKQSTGCVRLDINFLKPSIIELQGQGQVLHCGSLSSSPAWLEYAYRTSHPVLLWLPTKLAEWIGEKSTLRTCKRRWDFLTRQMGERARALGGHRTN